MVCSTVGYFGLFNALDSSFCVFLFLASLTFSLIATGKWSLGNAVTMSLSTSFTPLRSLLLDSVVSNSAYLAGVYGGYLFEL